MEEPRLCPVCDSPGPAAEAEGPEVIPFAGWHRLWRCKACGHRWAQEGDPPWIRPLDSRVTPAGRGR